MKIAARFFVFLVTACSAFAENPFCEPEDLDTIIEDLHEETDIDKDGASNTVTGETHKVMREGGRSALQIRSLSYIEGHQTRQILDACTIRPDSTRASAMNGIFDKETAVNASGFDRTRIIMVTFPELHLKSKISLKSSSRIRTPLIPGLFYSMGIPGISDYLKTPIMD